MLETYDVDTERFLDELPTREKYAILTLAMMIHEGHDDYEFAYDEATHKVSAQELTKYMMNYNHRFMWCHLQEVLSYGLSHFEVAWVGSANDSDEE